MLGSQVGEMREGCGAGLLQMLLSTSARSSESMFEPSMIDLTGIRPCRTCPTTEF